MAPARATDHVSRSVAPLIALHTQRHSSRRPTSIVVCGQSESDEQFNPWVSPARSIRHNASANYTGRPIVDSHLYERVVGASNPSDGLSRVGAVAHFASGMLASSGGRVRQGWTYVSSDLVCEHLMVRHLLLSCVVSLCVEVYSSTV